MSTVVIMAINLRSHGGSIYNVGHDQDAHGESSHNVDEDQDAHGDSTYNVKAIIMHM